MADLREVIGVADESTGLKAAIALNDTQVRLGPKFSF